MPEKQAFDFASMFANFSAAQKEWAETAERANRDWIAICEAEAKLSSQFATKMSSAKVPPDVVTAFQEWMAGRTELASKEWQRLVNSCSSLAGNGKIRSS